MSVTAAAKQVEAAAEACRMRDRRFPASPAARSLIAFAEHAADAVAVVGRDGTVLSLNAAGHALFGVPPVTGTDVTAPRAAEFCARGQDRLLRGAMRTVLQEGRAWHGDLQVHPAGGGAAFAVVCHALPLHLSPAGAVDLVAVTVRPKAPPQARRSPGRAARPGARQAELIRVQGLAGVGGFEIDLRDDAFPNRRSPEYLRLHGLADEAGGELHEAWLRRLHPDDRDAADARFRAAVAGDATRYANEYRIVAPDGAMRWISAVAEIERTLDGAPLRMVGAHTDITRLKEVEAALRDSESRCRSLFEGMQEGFVVADMMRDADGAAVDFRFVEVNPAFESLTGIAPADAIGRPVTAVIPGIQPELITLFGEVARTGEPAHFEVFIPALGGRWYEVRARNAGADDRFAALFLEVTARRRTEAALRESQARLQIAQQAAGAGIWDWNVATGRALWSRRNYELWGWPAPEAAGDTEVSVNDVISAIHPDDQRRVVENIQATIGAGAPFRSEFRVVGGDGAIRWIEALGRFVPPSAGAPQGRLIGANLDATEPHRIRAELERLNGELAAQVRAAVAEREDTQVRLVQALRVEALGQLAGGIAHDVNNVLQAVQGALSLIEKRPDDPESVRRFARLALDATRRGASVTSRLLTYTRRGVAEAEVIDVAATLRELHEMLSHTLGGSVAARLSLASDLPTVRTDKGQLETALINLAVNARDAMQSGGTLTIAALPEAVNGADAGGLPPGMYVRIAVIDTGDGMDAATLARVGDPFFTTKPVGFGTGLGIATVRRFVDQNGGRLDIESAPGRGTVVSLRLPACTTLSG